MKRFYRDGEAAGEVESISVANLLMLLSRGSGSGGEGTVGVSARSSYPDRVFECKTCNRQFSSFQALGGHRASHKRPRLPGGDGHAEPGKPRAHECSICGLEFAIGQALGGHMRRHRAAAGAGFSVLVEKKVVDSNDVRQEKRPTAPSLWLDLNMPPADGEADYRRKKIFGFEILDGSPIVVDCFH